MADVEFKSNAKQVLSAEEKAVKVVLTKIGMIVERDTKAKTPVDTGNLRNSFTNDVRAEEKAVYIGSNVEYAPYIEYGHRYGTSGKSYKGKHMLQNAINNNQRTIKNIIEKELGK